METWKAVVGYEGFYEVSDLGRVRRVKTGRILRPGKNNKGYYQVCLYKEGNRKTLKVHRLVLIAFVGLAEPGQEGNHKSGVKTDNYPENLEWMTSGQNQLHAYRVLGITPTRGEKHGRAKLTNSDIPVIRQFFTERKLLQKEIGAIFGVGKSTISRIKRGKNWAHVT